MASTKAKEQQAATGSNSLDEIKDLLNAKFSELGTRLTSLEDKLDSVTKDIHLKPKAVETTAQEASTWSTCAQENREEIGLKLAELNETVSNQAIIINQLEVEVDLKSRSLRKTLIFRNIKKQQSEKTWDDTKMVLANEISKNMQDFLKEEIIRYTERTHQVITANRSPSVTSALPFLVAKITNWDMLEKIKSAIIKANQEGNSAVFVSQMYSKSLTEERNAALKY